MSDADIFAARINEYVSQFGTESVMDVDGVLSAAKMTDKKGSILPTDYCYNRYNNGLGEFDGPHLFEYTDDKKFRVLGENYPYTGNVMHKPKGAPEYVWAHWTAGKLTKGEPENLPESILLRRNDLKESLEEVLKAIPVTVSTKERDVLINFQELLICGVVVEDETYKIYNASSDWADKTTYLCEESEDGTWHYYLETIDECIGECQRLVMFEAQKGNNTKKAGSHTSELSKVLDRDTFERTYRLFLEQADQNVASGSGNGGQTPKGFDKKPNCDGADVSTHYGMGNASKTPYLCWWVVSIYYLPDSGNIVMAIEEDRYPHLKEMTIKPLRYSRIGNKKVDAAVFYSTTKNDINYDELHEQFISVCEEVMRLGLR